MKKETTNIVYMLPHRRYVPPEFRNKGLHSETWDIYSLGVIIMEIVVGTGAYEEIDDMSHQQAIELVSQSHSLCLVFVPPGR